MTYTYLKTAALMLSASALLVLSGCDGTTGTASNNGIGEVLVVVPPVDGNVIPQPVIPPVEPIDTIAPIITENPSIASAGTLDGSISLTVNEDVTAGLYVNGLLIDTTSDLDQDIPGVFTVKVQDTFIDV